MSNKKHGTPGAFNFNKLMQHVYKETNNADPRDFAERVFCGIPPHCYDEVLQAVLPRYCSWYSSVERMRIRGTITRSTKPSKTKLSVRPRVVKPPQQEAINRKYAGWQKAWLRQRVATQSGCKFLSQCGVADLNYMILELEENAAESTAVAQGYRRVRDALIKYKVEKVEDLPVEVLQTFARKAAT